MSGLESRSSKTLEKLFIIYSLVKIIALDNARLEFFVFEEELVDLLFNELWRDDFRLAAHCSTINKRIIR